MKKLTTRQAASLLGVTVAMVLEYRRMDYIKGRTSSGETGRGRRFYFDAGEIIAMRDGGAPAAKAYRKSTMGGKKTAAV